MTIEATPEAVTAPATKEAAGAKKPAAAEAPAVAPLEDAAPVAGGDPGVQEPAGPVLRGLPLMSRSAVMVSTPTLTAAGLTVYTGVSATGLLITAVMAGAAALGVVAKKFAPSRRDPHWGFHGSRGARSTAGGGSGRLRGARGAGRGAGGLGGGKNRSGPLGRMLGGRGKGPGGTGRPGGKPLSAGKRGAAAAGLGRSGKGGGVRGLLSRSGKGGGAGLGRSRGRGANGGGRARRGANWLGKHAGQAMQRARAANVRRNLMIADLWNKTAGWAAGGIGDWFRGRFGKSNPSLGEMLAESLFNTGDTPSAEDVLADIQADRADRIAFHFDNERNTIPRQKGPMEMANYNNPFGGIAEGAADAANWTPENARYVMTWYESLKEALGGAASTLGTNGKALVEQFPMDPAAGQQAQALAGYMGQLAGFVAEAEATFYKLHADKIAHINSSDPRMDKWDKSKNHM